MDELYTRHNFSFGPFDFIFTELSERVVGFATKKNVFPIMHISIFSEAYGPSKIMRSDRR